MFYRICPTHRTEVHVLKKKTTEPDIDPDSDPISSHEILKCLSCPKPHSCDTWLIAGDDEVLYGLAGRSCGGYVAFTPEEWDEIPGLIRDAIDELKEEIEIVNAAWFKEEAQVRLEGLEALHELAMGLI